MDGWLLNSGGALAKCALYKVQKPFKNWRADEATFYDGFMASTE
jgi:hypothetical protein